MPQPRLLVLGYSESAMLLAGSNQADVKALISICGTHEHPLDAADIRCKLTLHFDDAEVPDLSDPNMGHAAWIKQRYAREMGRPLTPPTIEDAHAIISFARSTADLDGALLCQCQGGISRSPAAALICLTTWTGPGRERECVEHLLKIRPCAAPHADLVRFADRILHRNGELIRACTTR